MSVSVGNGEKVSHHVQTLIGALNTKRSTSWLINKRDAIKPFEQMALYGLSLIMVKGASFITLPLMTHFLSPADIGQLELLATMTVFFSLLIGVAMHENLYRFIATLKRDKARKQLASQLYYSTLMLSLSLCCMFGLLAYAALSWTSSVISPVQQALLGWVVMYESALAISFAWLRLHNKAWLFFKVSVVTTLLQVSLVVASLYWQPNVTTIFAIGVCCSTCQFVWLHCHNRFNLQLLNFQQLLGMLKYSAPLMVSALIAFGLNGGERWVLAAQFDLATLGVYAIAAKFALALGIALQPFHMWWMPKRFETWRSSGDSVTATKTQRGILLACSLSLLVSGFSQFFILFALPEDYKMAASLTTIALIAMLFKELTELTNIGILKSKQTHTLLLVNLLITGVTFALFWALSLDSIWYMVLILAGSQFARFSVITICSQRHAYLPYQFAPLAMIVVLTTFALLMNAYIIEPLWMMSITSSCFGLSAFIAYRYQLFNSDKHVRQNIGTSP